MLTYRESAALYEAFAGAEWPRHGMGGGGANERRMRRVRGGPVPNWRCAVLLWLLYGFRTGDLVWNRTGHDPLRWGQVSFEPRTPDPSGSAECPHGWLWFSPMKVRRGRDRLTDRSAGRPLALPLTAEAAAHLKAVRPLKCDPERPVFDWPKDHPRFRETWAAAVKRACVQPRRYWDGREMDVLPKHLRTTAATRMSVHRPGLESVLLGHAPKTVAAGYYVQPGDRLAEAFATLPHPLTGGSAAGDAPPAEPGALAFPGSARPHG